MTEAQLTRNAAKRLAVIRHAKEVRHNVALTGRYHGVYGARVCASSACSAIVQESEALEGVGQRR